ncbi:hypothetical protein TNCT_520041 [Trichonephila clavata]|uniref:Uncharacterized protein n=1 Tax=Trichonephila clavata TaxID=2740835 RepID=A0A8X6JKC0_TRICU|nr:hypothetical protein TNCT_520041 [Trichonephila clavata]
MKSSMQSLQTLCKTHQTNTCVFTLTILASFAFKRQRYRSFNWPKQIVSTETLPQLNFLLKFAISQVSLPPKGFITHGRRGYAESATRNGLQELSYTVTLAGENNFEVTPAKYNCEFLKTLASCTDPGCLTLTFMKWQQKRLFKNRPP